MITEIASIFTKHVQTFIFNNFDVANSPNPVRNWYKEIYEKDTR